MYDDDILNATSTREPSNAEKDERKEILIDLVDECDSRVDARPKDSAALL